MAAYSRSSDLMTSAMKSEPGRSTTMSPGIIFSLLLWVASFAPLSAAAASTGAALTPTPAAAVFRKLLRSTPPFFSSAIACSSVPNALVLRKSLTLRIRSGTRFRIQEPAQLPDDFEDHAAFRGCRAHREGRADDRDGRLYASHSIRGRA